MSGKKKNQKGCRGPGNLWLLQPGIWHSLLVVSNMGCFPKLRVAFRCYRAYVGISRVSGLGFLQIRVPVKGVIGLIEGYLESRA